MFFYKSLPKSSNGQSITLVVRNSHLLWQKAIAESMHHCAVRKATSKTYLRYLLQLLNGTFELSTLNSSKDQSHSKAILPLLMFPDIDQLGKPLPRSHLDGLSLLHLWYDQASFTRRYVELYPKEHPDKFCARLCIIAQSCIFYTSIFTLIPT